MKKDFAFRPAVLDDCRRYYQWRKEDTVREASFEGDMPEYSEHESWFREKMRDPNCHMYVITVEGKEAAQVRFENTGTISVISISVAPEYRGKRLGSKAISFFSRMMVEEKGSRRIEAYIKKGNRSSLRAFTGSGYISDGDVLIKGQEAVRLIYELK